MVDSIKDILYIITAIISICVSLFALYKFLSRPQDSLLNRLNNLEKEFKDYKQQTDSQISAIKNELNEDNDKFKEQENTNAVFKAVMLSFVDFEIAYCMHTGYELTDDLMKAKKILNKYLTGKSNDED